MMKSGNRVRQSHSGLACMAFALFVAAAGCGGSNGGPGGDPDNGGSGGDDSGGSPGSSGGKGGVKGGGAGESGGGAGGEGGMSAGGSGGSAGAPAGGSGGGGGGSGGGSGGSAGGKGGSSSGGAAGASATDAGATPDGGGTAGTGGGGETLHWVAYGDTRTNASTHQKVIDAISKLNPELVVHSGDLWDEYSSGSSQWSGIIMKNANIAALLQKNLFLVAQGNHESSSELLAFKPTLVRNNSVRYSTKIGNSFFVVLGLDPSASAAVTYLQQQLATPEAKSATWRFVFSHYPTWNGGDHANDGYPALEKVMDEGNVTIHFGGHDHNYQRSYQLFGQKPVDMSDALQAAKGTVYIVSGGGGAPLYPCSKIPNLKFVSSTNNFVEVTVDATTVDIKAWNLSGKMIDAFKITR